MPRIIVKSGYMKDGIHREYYTKYIATRDGVELINSTSGHLPATKKQKTLINQLLSDYPDSCSFFEYEDYIKNPTRKNASQLITTVMDYNINTVLKKENYVGYIANRPRVERLGQHGLFSSTDEVINLNEVAKEVRDHGGNVWTHIISLKREDASRLGYDHAENWKHLCRIKANEVATAMKIDPVNLKWYASYHDEGHHPHIHMIAYSTHHKEGYLTIKGIENIRRVFAKEIFQQDLLQIYQEQTKIRDELKRYSKELVTNCLVQLNEKVCEGNEILFEKMRELKQSLENYHGRLFYGYIPQKSKQIVNDILRELEKDQRLQQLYEQWYVYKEDVIKTYTGKLEERLPLLEQKEFKSIKNMLIKEVMNADINANTEIEFIMKESLNTEIESIEFHNFDNNEETHEIFEKIEDYELEDKKSKSDSIYLEWSDDYKKSVSYFYGSTSIQQDMLKAKELLIMESQKHNVLAYELLAKFYELQDNPKVAEEYYQLALKGSLEILESDGNAFIQSYLSYKVGKFYFYGKGTNQDYEKAHQYFLKSQNKYAMYSLGTMYQRGLGVTQSHEDAFHYYEQSAKRNHPFAHYEVGYYYENGYNNELNIEKANQHYEKAYHGFLAMCANRRDDHLLYRLGMMSYYGKGTKINKEQAILYLEESATMKNENAKYMLAKIYLEEDMYAKIPEALKWLEESKQVNASYILGKEYHKGLHVEKDITKAIQYYLKCNEHSFALYQLGMIYLTEEGFIDNSKAITYLKQSASFKNPFAQTVLGNLYLQGNVIEKNIEEAIYHLENASRQNNMFAQYLLGKLFLFGKDVAQDKDKAIEYLVLSAEQGNEYAQYLLEHMDDYQNQPYALLTARLFHHMSRIFEKRLPNNQSVMQEMTDKKLAHKIKLKKIAQGHNEKDRNMSIR